jgi:hypothetical protein
VRGALSKPVTFLREGDTLSSKLNANR